MPRPYESASSLDLGGACEYAYGLRYIQGWREPDVTWEDIDAGRVRVVERGVLPGPGECTPSQRSTALGSAVHAVGEVYMAGSSTPIDWGRLPAKIYASGIQHLPDRGTCSVIEIEDQIGASFLEGDKRFERVLVGPGGIRLVGKRDLLVGVTAKERDRLGLRGTLVQYDYKSSANVLRYAKSERELRADLQACAYAWDYCEQFDALAAPGRWLYLESKAIRRSLPVDFEIERDLAGEVLEQWSAVARHLATLKSLDDCKQDVSRCEDYGGRSCHASRGGPCNPRRYYGTLIQLSRKEKPDMTPEERKAAFEARKKTLAAVTTEEAPEDETPAAAPTRKPRAARKAPEPPPEPEPEAVEEAEAEGAPDEELVADPIARFEDLTDRVVEARRALDEAKADLADAVAAL